MPHTKNHSDNRDQGRANQSFGRGEDEESETRDMQSGDQRADREDSEGESRQVQSQSGGPTGRGKVAKNEGGEARVSGESEDAESRDMQSNEDGDRELDENEQPIKAPGGDGRASVSTDGRNDGKPDAPMPSLDGSRK